MRIDAVTKAGTRLAIVGVLPMQPDMVEVEIERMREIPWRNTISIFDVDSPPLDELRELLQAERMTLGLLTPADSTINSFKDALARLGRAFASAPFESFRLNSTATAVVNVTHHGYANESTHRGDQSSRAGNREREQARALRHQRRAQRRKERRAQRRAGK